MGQLEKYGLYVLCLVIFLILGVALWGEPVAAGETPGKTSERTAEVPARATSPSYDLSDFKLADPKESRSASVHPEDRKVAEATPGNGTAGGDGKGVGAKESPRPADAPVAKPETRRLHVIVAGDTFEGIAKQELGDARLITLLRDLNPKVVPEKLQLGKTLVLPTAAELAASRAKNAPADPKADRAVDRTADRAADKTDRTAKPTKPPAKVAAGRTHTIARGDTLEGLSIHYFGSAKRLDDIKKLNPSVDPTRLRVGQLIRLPD